MDVLTPETPAAVSPEFGRLAAELDELRATLVAFEGERAAAVEDLPEERRESARNLLHYLALRRRDVRDLQERLASFGLSSLGRAEAQVLDMLDAVRRAVAGLAGTSASFAPRPARGRERLEANTDALLGPPREGRSTRIMVTMPSDAARDYALVRDLVARGMDAMRVNCAHDDREVWGAMAENLRRAEREVGRSCPLLMDLGGPKLRTGALAQGPAVVHFRPVRDARGILTSAARVWLTPSESPAAPPDVAEAVLPVPGAWLAELRPRDAIRVEDARGTNRFLRTVGEAGASRWAEGLRTTYVGDGAELVNKRTGASSRVQGIAPREEPLVLRAGDALLLTKDPAPGRPAVRDARGRLLSPATIPCTLPEVFLDLKRGERISFDDGRIWGVIRSVSADQVLVDVTLAKEKGDKLRSDKGINLPDSRLRLPALTARDLDDLPFVAAHADLIGLSFVRRPEDVDELRARLAPLGGRARGVVLKIETRHAFEALPDLLLAALRLPAAGIMIARGDLLVECGWERLAEIQEEILWLAEAAHLPVVWATQVLESLAQKGQPSRAEITDAAMGARAECVMLNKGPHILETIDVLDGILRRMARHQDKKSARLRRLSF